MSDMKKAILSAIQDVNRRGSVIADRSIGNGSFYSNTSSEKIEFVVFFRSRHPQFDKQFYSGYVYVNNAAHAINFSASLNDCTQPGVSLQHAIAKLWIDNTKSVLIDVYPDMIDFSWQTTIQELL